MDTERGDFSSLNYLCFSHSLNFFIFWQDDQYSFKLFCAQMAMRLYLRMWYLFCTQVHRVLFFCAGIHNIKSGGKKLFQLNHFQICLCASKEVTFTESLLNFPTQPFFHCKNGDKQVDTCQALYTHKITIANKCHSKCLISQKEKPVFLLFNLTKNFSAFQWDGFCYEKTVVVQVCVCVLASSRESGKFHNIIITWSIFHSLPSMCLILHNTESFYSERFVQVKICW